MSKSTELKPVDQYCYISVSECNKRSVILIYHIGIVYKQKLIRGCSTPYEFLI